MIRDDVVQTRNARGGQGRKIDEWRVKLPARETATFDVLLSYEDGEVCFTLASQHGSFARTKLVGNDLNQLRADLNDLAATVIRNELSAGWEPARKLEVRHEAVERRRGQFAFDLHVRLDDIEHLPAAVAGNRGETVIREGDRQTTIVQRAFSDDFSDVTPASGSLTDPAVQEYLRSPFRGEDLDRTTRSVLPGRERDILDLLDTLSGFSEALSQRLSPAALAVGGVPAPGELVDLMRLAADAERRDIPLHVGRIKI